LLTPAQPVTIAVVLAAIRLALKKDDENTWV